MVKVRILKTEQVTDDRHDPPEVFDVFLIEMRHGLETWIIRRKYKAFMQLDSMLRHKFHEESGLTGLPQDPSGHERELIKEFIEKVTSNSLLLKTAEARSFFEVPSSKRLMDLSDDASRSILSLPLVHIPGLKFPDWFPEITIAHCLLLLVLLGTSLPMSGIGGPPEARPIAAGICLVVGMWQIVQPDGIIDLILEKLFGKDNVVFARGMIRLADLPLVWMSLGMVIGAGLASSHPYSPQMLMMVLLCASVGIFSFINLLVTLALVQSRRKKRS